MMDLHFFYDVVCPWAYLASTRVEALAAETGARLVWKPILLGGVFRHVGTPQRPAEAVSPARARVGHEDLLRTADFLGVPLNFPPEHPRRTVQAMRLVVGAPEAVRPELSKALWRAYWVEGRDVADPAVLADVAWRFGVDPAVADDPAVKQELFDRTAEAAALGVFGVPTFGVGGRIWWGVDRMPLVREVLGGRRPEDIPVSREPGSHLTFFHDFASPFSYLASTQVERVARRHGATVEWAPILLGGLFRDIGTADVPLLTMNGAKQRYYTTDMTDWARWWGVPFRFPSTFPLRTVLPLRVAVAEPRTTSAIYRAAWAEDRDVGHQDVLGDVLTSAGFDVRDLFAKASSADVKAKLRDNGERAKAAGACGAPTFLVTTPGRPDVLLWGQDRIDQLEAALRGWRAGPPPEKP